MALSASIFGWIIPVVIIANIPARLLIKSFGQPASADASSGCRIDHCVLAVRVFLEICPAALLQRQLVTWPSRSCRSRCPGARRDADCAARMLRQQAMMNLCYRISLARSGNVLN